jgi:hypothetical protein
MTRQEKAIYIFRQQFNFSQAVFAAYRDADRVKNGAPMYGPDPISRMFCTPLSDA